MLYDDKGMPRISLTGRGQMLITLEPHILKSKRNAYFAHLVQCLNWGFKY